MVMLLYKELFGEMVGKREILIKEIVMVGGLIGMQVVIAANSVFLSYLMTLGLTPYTLVIFTTSATFLLISPLALYFERSKWPKKLTFKFIAQLIFISFVGVYLFQSLLLKGIKLTSPAMATAMANLAPGLIFLIAWTFRLEKVDLSCIYSRVKIVGTILCVVGAITLSLMHSTPVIEPQLSFPQIIINHISFDKDKIIGCIYLVASIFVLSSNVVLQASILGDFPAPMSFCAITSLFGVIITIVVQLIQFHKIDTGSTRVSTLNLVGIALLEGMISGSCLSFSGWAMKKKGPVLVALFNPVGTVVSVLLSVAAVGDTFKLGSLAGMTVLFIGLYLVLWAKGKEILPHLPLLETDHSDLKKPLLS